VDSVVQIENNKINCGWCCAEEKLQNKRVQKHIFLKIASGGRVTWCDIYGNSGEQ
jgi:hypothetical protein